MRSRSSRDDRVAELTRQRLEALITELGAQRAESQTRQDEGADVGGETSPTIGGPEEAVHGDPARDPDADAAAEPVGRHARRPLDARSRVAGWWADRIPPALRAQPHLGSAQVGLVAFVLAAGLVLGAWWLVRGRGETLDPVTVQPPTVAVAPSAGSPVAGPAGAASPFPGSPSGSATPGTGADPGAGTGPGTGAATGAATGVGGTGSGTLAVPGGHQIIVDVVGRVRRPGIAVLPVGSRVVDAVEAAGGLRPGFPAAAVNMARVLADGEQVLIRPQATSQGSGSPGSVSSGGPVTSAGGSPAGTQLVNLNTADQAALETLPDVGPVTAAAILEWRAQHGGFGSVDELLEVSGIGEVTLAKIAPHVTL